MTKARGKVYKRRGLEAAMTQALAGLWGTEPSLWAGRCYECGGETATRYPGRTQREAMTRLCDHLRTKHARGMRALLRGFHLTP